MLRENMFNKCKLAHKIFNNLQVAHEIINIEDTTPYLHCYYIHSY